MTAEIIYLADLRPDPQAESDLRWFFNDADGEMSHGSNYGAMVAKIETGPTGTSSMVNRGYDPRQVAAAGRARPISKALKELAEHHRETLLVAYREQLLVERFGRLALAELAPYGAVAGLVALSPQTELARVASRTTRPLVEWLARLARPSASPRARLIRSEVTRGAEARLLAATRAYASASREERARQRILAAGLRAANDVQREIYFEEG